MFLRQSFPGSFIHLPQFRAGFERLFLMRGGFPVPRADLLADIATENPVLKFVFIFLRQFTLGFNGMVRDAPACVEQTGCEDGTGRAGIDSTGAAPAEIVDLLLFVLQFQVSDDLADENEGADLWVDQAGILPDPAQAGFFSP